MDCIVSNSAMIRTNMRFSMATIEEDSAEISLEKSQSDEHGKRTRIRENVCRRLIIEVNNKQSSREREKSVIYHTSVIYGMTKEEIIRSRR